MDNLVREIIENAHTLMADLCVGSFFFGAWSPITDIAPKSFLSTIS